MRNNSVFIDPGEAAVSTGLQMYTGAGSTQLAYRFWTTGSRSRPVLVYVHGIEGHSRWFDRAATQLSLRGINVYAADRRGAALNKDADNSSIVVRKTLLSDLNAFLNAIRLQHPDSNLYLLGNCWGGTLSILYAAAAVSAKITGGAGKTGSVSLSGLILSCPAIKTICDVNLPTKLSIAWSYLCNSKKEFLFPLTPEMFTQNPQYLEFIYNDTLRTTAASASFLIETLKMQRLAAAADLNLPVLLLQASADAIVDRAAVTRWFARLSSSEKNCQLFDGASHSLDFEPDISRYLDAITNWIERG